MSANANAERCASLLAYATDPADGGTPPAPCAGPRWSPVHYPGHPLFHAFAPPALREEGPRA